MNDSYEALIIFNYLDILFKQSTYNTNLLITLKKIGMRKFYTY